MKKLWVLFLLPLLLTGCTVNNNNSNNGDDSSGGGGKETEKEAPDGSGGINDYNFSITNELETYNLKEVLQNEFIHTEANYYGGTFVDVIPEPNLAPTSLEEIADIYDFCAFYKKPSISFELNYSHSSTLNEVNTAFWISSMAPGVSGVRKDIKGNQVTLHFAYSYLANSFHSITPMINNVAGLSVVPYLFSGTKITNIPYTGGANLDVYNSDQLIYALSNHYTPVMEENSPAKVIYDKACSILKDIIYEEMDANEKLLAIECYLNSTVVYDYCADGYASCISKYHKYNYEEVSCLASAFYAEGPLLYGSSVCYGYARAQALLSLLLGYDVKLIHTPIQNEYAKTSTDPVMHVDRGGVEMHYYNAHGINLVEVNGKYGICDPTYRFAGSTTYRSRQYEVRRKPAVMLNLSDWMEIYSEVDYDIFALYQSILVQTSFDGPAHLKMANGMNQRCNGTAEGLETAIANIENTVTSYKTLNGITREQVYCFEFYVRCYSEYEKDVADDAFVRAYQQITSPCFYYYFYGYYFTHIYGYSIFVVR